MKTKITGNAFKPAPTDANKQDSKLNIRNTRKGATVKIRVMSKEYAAAQMAAPKSIAQLLADENAQVLLPTWKKLDEVERYRALTTREIANLKLGDSFYRVDREGRAYPSKLTGTAKQAADFLSSFMGKFSGKPRGLILVRVPDNPGSPLEIEESIEPSAGNESNPGVRKAVENRAMQSDEADTAAEIGLEKSAGFQSDPRIRQAIEQHAMNHAKRTLEGNGYGNFLLRGKPYDYECKKDGKTFYVEVKGTQTDGSRVILTKNEVAHAQKHPDCSILFVLHSVVLDRNTLEATNGTPRLIEGWKVYSGDLNPIQYEYSVPNG